MSTKFLPDDIARFFLSGSPTRPDKPVGLLNSSSLIVPHGQHKPKNVSTSTNVRVEVDTNIQSMYEAIELLKLQKPIPHIVEAQAFCQDDVDSFIEAVGVPDFIIPPKPKGEIGFNFMGFPIKIDASVPPDTIRVVMSDGEKIDFNI